MPNPDREKDSVVLDTFKKRKVMVIDEITEILGCSVPTVRRRLKQWHTYTSHNYNGRYYTLPDIPRFDENGLWKYREILFCKHGNLRQALIHLIIHSPAGLTTREAEGILQVSMGSFMPCFRNIPQVRREKPAGQFVYFSFDEQTFIQQKEKRLKDIERVRLIRPPTDAEAVIILVERIKYPHLSVEQLSMRLNKRGLKIRPEVIRNLFEHHGILKKTSDMQW